MLCHVWIDPNTVAELLIQEDIRYDKWLFDYVTVSSIGGEGGPFTTQLKEFVVN